MRRRSLFVCAVVLSAWSAARGVARADELQRGVAAYNDGELAKAERHLLAATKALAEGSRRARAWLFLGLAQSTRGAAAEARRSFAQALRDDPAVRPDPRRVSPPIRKLFDEVRSRAVGWLYVDAPEKNARVFVGDKEVGRTPLKMKLAIGRRRVRVVSSDGRRHFVQSDVLIGGREPARISAELRPRMGQVRITSHPPGGDIFSGPRLLGKTPQVLTLPAGPHRLTVMVPGHRPVASSVDVNPDKRIDLLVELPKIVVPWYRSRRFWGYVTLGVAGAAATGGLLVAKSAQSSSEAIHSGQRDATLTFDRYRSLASSVHSNERIANVLLGVSGAAAITGLVLIIVGDRTPEEKRAPQAWRFLPTPTGAVLMRRF